MRYLLAITLSIFSSSASAESITPEEIRSLVLDRNFPALEQAMSSAQSAFEAGQTNAEHLRDLNMVFVTTSPIIQEATEEWLETYPDSVYAIMANAWIADKVAWTIRGTGYSSTVYQDSWPAFYAASEKSAELSQRAYALDPDYLPASDGLMAHALYRNLDLNIESIVDTVMDTTPNAGTLIRGLNVAHKGWGGSYDEGERLCAVHAHKVIDWGDQAFDICMIHLAFNYTRWRPMRAFAERLLRTDHPAILDIRRQVVAKSNFYYPGWYETVSQLDFPKEEWRQDLIELVHSEGFSDLKMANDFDSRFGNYTDLEMVTDKVRLNARANAEAVLEYDPYNIEAIDTLLNHESYEVKPDGHRGLKPIESLNSKERHSDLRKRRVMAKPWDAVGWMHLAWLYPHMPRSEKELLNRRDLERNYIVYSNHMPIQLRDFIDTTRSLIDSRERALSGKVVKGQEWLLDVEPVQTLLCPVARAKVLLDARCNSELPNVQLGTCKRPIYKVEKLDAIVKEMSEAPGCILSQHPELPDIAFTAVDVNVMAIEVK